mgnify:FL=1
MNYFRINNIEALQDFPNQSSQLAIMNRSMPKNSTSFFEKLVEISFNIIGEVNKDTAIKDVKNLLSDKIPKEIKNDFFYEIWVKDMANLCEMFCITEKSSYISFSLSSHRGCRRYHIDNVPLRLLVTYAGQGTEWLPDEFANKRAYANGEPNEKIIKDISKKQFVGEWDIALFKGGPEGLLHRTPDSALNNNSILMRLDHARFWKDIQRNVNQNKK